MVSLENFVKAWTEGKVCLHPTDTLPGLSFNPQRHDAEQTFVAIKARPPGKSPISLVAGWEVVSKLWEPLPLPWESILKDLWPAPLSVIWKASASCPETIIASDGTCGLRMPAWTPDRKWMHDLLTSLATAFPSSSVNLSGQASIGDWREAEAFLKDQSLAYVPELSDSQIESLRSTKVIPSTLIRIESDGTWTSLREGALSKSVIQMKWEQYAKRS